jgi:hypothetical protein
MASLAWRNTSNWQGPTAENETVDAVLRCVNQDVQCETIVNPAPCIFKVQDSDVLDEGMLFTNE